MKVFACFLSTIIFLSCDHQQADPLFDATVLHPAFTVQHPVILFDEGHNNIHTASGTYAPLAELMKNDGYSVSVNKDLFTAEELKGFGILIISNAKGSERKDDPAFSEEECSAMEEWVRNGGSLLLIADHHPMGAAARSLSARFGVTMNGGFTNDSVYFDSTSYTQSRIDGKSQLVFSRENGLLNSTPITQGRDSGETVRRIITFTGQSLKGPVGASSFLTLSPHAADVVPDSIWDEKEMLFFTNTHTRFAEPVSAAGNSQGLALEYGRGRVVILGEAAMLTAQRYKDEQFGMQVKGIDNKQLALNIMHWLSRVM